MPEGTESSGCSEAKGRGGQEGAGLPRQPGKSRFESQGKMTELDRGPWRTGCEPEMAEDMWGSLHTAWATPQVPQERMSQGTPSAQSDEA